MTDLYNNTTILNGTLYEDADSLPEEYVSFVEDGTRDQMQNDLNWKNIEDYTGQINKCFESETCFNEKGIVFCFNEDTLMAWKSKNPSDFEALMDLIPVKPKGQNLFQRLGKSHGSVALFIPNSEKKMMEDFKGQRMYDLLHKYVISVVTLTGGPTSKEMAAFLKMLHVKVKSNHSNNGITFYISPVLYAALCAVVCHKTMAFYAQEDAVTFEKNTKFHLANMPTVMKGAIKEEMDDLRETMQEILLNQQSILTILKDNNMVSKRRLNKD